MMSVDYRSGSHLLFLSPYFIIIIFSYSFCLNVLFECSKLDKRENMGENKIFIHFECRKEEAALTVALKQHQRRPSRK